MLVTRAPGRPVSRETTHVGVKDVSWRPAAAGHGEGDSSSLTRTRIQDGGASDEVSWRSCTLHSGLQLRVQGIKATDYWRLFPGVSLV